MRRAGVFFRALSISAICIFSASGQAAAEEITISTYYPSPYGSYEELRSNKMVIGQEADGSVIPAPPSGGLTLAPQVIGDGTNVPEGTLMYDKGKKTLTYWDGAAWEAVKKEGAYIGTADMEETLEFNTAGGWSDQNIIVPLDSAEDSTGCKYATIKIVDGTQRMFVDLDACDSNLFGGGIYRVTWGGDVSVDAGSNADTFFLRLRGKIGTRASFTVEEVKLADEDACKGLKGYPGKIVSCAGLGTDGAFYPETINGEVLLSVYGEARQLQFWIQKKTKGSDEQTLANIKSGFKIRIDKMP